MCSVQRKEHVVNVHYSGSYPPPLPPHYWQKLGGYGSQHSLLARRRPLRSYAKNMSLANWILRT